MTDCTEFSAVVLLLDDDPVVTEGLALGLEREGRAVITCNDLESAQLAVEWFRPTHIVADVRLSGPFAFEGLDFIHYAKRHSPESKIVLMTGSPSEALALEASQRGAASFLEKPFDGRDLAAFIEETSAVAASPARPSVFMRIPALDEVLVGTSLYSVFQPIVELGAAVGAFGYEALARCRTDSPLRNPARLFEYAARKQRVCDLELACIAGTLKAAAPLLTSGMLFVNIHPKVFAEGTRLLDLLSGEGEDLLSKLVLEVTEQAALLDTPAVLDTIERIRETGVRFAFDDFGVAYSHLPLIDRVQPSFLKISQDFGTQFESSPTKVKIVRNLCSIANDFGCDLILEGIEDASTAEAAADLGIRLGQGFLFGRPTEAKALV